MERRVALIVDPDRSTGELISRLVRERGYEATAATTYVEALKLFEATDPHLVVIDPVLSDGDGFELVRIAKPSARVVLTSANPTRVGEVAEKLGVPLVVKPFATDELMAHVE